MAQLAESANATEDTYFAGGNSEASSAAAAVPSNGEEGAATSTTTVTIDGAPREGGASPLASPASASPARKSGTAPASIAPAPSGDGEGLRGEELAALERPVGVQRDEAAQIGDGGEDPHGVWLCIGTCA